jgi:hypothetical protein
MRFNHSVRALKKSSMMSVAAAALIAASGVAYGQGMGQGTSGTPAGNEIHKAPPGATGPSRNLPNGSVQHGTTGAGSTEQGAMPGKAPAEKIKPQQSGQGELKHPAGTTGQGAVQERKVQEPTTKQAPGHVTGPGKVQERYGTTGQGAAGARPATNLTAEQRTRITSVIRRETHVRPIEHVNFALRVGTHVPRSVHLYRLPAEVVTIYPEWRGYEYVLVEDQILVINPRTLEIVAVLEA